MTDWQCGQDLKWRLLSPFGVEVDDDLSAPLSAAAQTQFKQLFFQHGLVIARSQNLSMEQQQSLASLLGPILLRKGESGYLSNEGEHEVVKSGLSFHADAAYTDHPFTAIGLHGVDVVDGASSTVFANAQHALERLPAPLRETLSQHEVELISPGINNLTDRMCNIPEPEAMKRGILAAVHTHPETGQRYLNVSEMHATQLQGMSWQESAELLNQVFDTLYAKDNIYEHIWHRGDLVLWDNIALQHARGSLKDSGRRILQRVIVGVEGEIPFAS